MDYHTLPRRQLQTLCKKHGIPANSTNSEMADALTTLLKPKTQLRADNSKQPEKRATRSRQPALKETMHEKKDLEEESNMKIQKPACSHEKLEDEMNKKPQRTVRSVESASVATQAPNYAALKTEKIIATGERESISASIHRGTKIEGTRNGASNQNNRGKSAESVNSKAESPKSERKKDKSGGILLRRGRVKVRSPGNLSKSPESKKVEEVAANSEGNSTAKERVGLPSSQSCLVGTKKRAQTRRKKQSVTFSDILEEKLGCSECSAGEDVLEISNNCKDPAGVTVEISQAGHNQQRSLESACVAKEVVGTRKGSRTAARKDCVQEMVAAQGGQQKSHKEPIANKNNAEEPHVFYAGKSVDIETGGESRSARSVRSKKVSTLVAETAVEGNGEEKVVNSFVEGYQIKDVLPALKTRRSRGLIIAASDVKPDQDKESTIEELKVKSEDEGCSIASKTIGGALPAETSRRSRRRTLAPLELNHVQSNVETDSEQIEKKVSQVTKAKDTQSKAELKNGDLPESQRKHSETRISQSIPVVTEAEGKPMNLKVLTAGNVRNSRRKTILASDMKHIQPAEDQLNISTTGIVDKSESVKARSKTRSSKSMLVCSEPEFLQEVSNEGKEEVKATKATSVRPRSTTKATKISTYPDTGNAVSQKPDFETQSKISKHESLNYLDEAMDKMSSESEDLDVTSSACIEHYIESPVLKDTDEPVVQENVNFLSNDTYCNSKTFQSLCQQTSTDRALVQSTYPDTGNAVSQKPDLETQSKISKHESLNYLDEAMDKMSRESEDLDVTSSACIEHSLESPVLKDTDEPVVQENVNLVFNDTYCDSKTFQSLCQQTPTDSALEQYQVSSEDPSSFSCNEGPESGFHTIDVGSSSMTATHSATCESETPDSSSLVGTEPMKLVASAVKCGELTEDTSSYTISARVQQGHETSIEKDTSSDMKAILVLEQDEVRTSSSLMNDIRDTLGSSLPASMSCSDEGNLDGHHDINGNELENSLLIHTDEVTTASSPAVTIESSFEHQTSVDQRVSEQELCSSEMHLLGSARDQIVNLAIIGAADLTLTEGQEYGQAVECERKFHDDLKKDQLQDVSEGMLCCGEKSVDEQLLPLLPSCSLTPGLAPPRESACKTKQRRPRSIYKSARKAKSAVPWENRSFEEVEYSGKEDRLMSWDQKEKDAEVWGLNTHDVASDEGDSSSSEEEESSEETGESLSDTDVCNFNTDVLIFSTEGESSYSEDNTISDSGEGTEFNSEEEFCEMEEELLSGEEFYENEESDTSGEDLSESEEDDSGDEAAAFDNCEAYPCSQSVANSQTFDALNTTAGFEDRCMEHIADFKSSLPNDEVTEGEARNCLGIENLTNGFFLNLGLKQTDKTSGGLTSMDTVQSTTACMCQEDSWLSSLSSLFVTPPSKLKEDDNCLLAPPSEDISENATQQSKFLETEHILSNNGEEVSHDCETHSQPCCTCELLHEGIAKVEQQDMDGAKHETEFCESLGYIETGQEINGEVLEVVPSCTGDIPTTGPTVVDCFSVPVMLDNVEESNFKSAFINPRLTGKSVTKVLPCESMGLSLSTPGSGNKKSAFITESESTCELFHKIIGAEMKDSGICEEAFQSRDECGSVDSETAAESTSSIVPASCTNDLQARGVHCSVADMKISPDTIVLTMQEKIDDFKIIQECPCGIEEDKAGNLEVGNALEKEERSVGTDLDLQKGTADCIQLLDLGEGTTSELSEELRISGNATPQSATLVVDSNPNGTEATEGQVVWEALNRECDCNHQSLTSENGCNIDDLSQEQNNEDASAFSLVCMTMGATDSVVSLDSVKDAELSMVTADAKLHILSPEITIEKEESLANPECEQSKTGILGKVSEAIQLESNVDSNVSQVMPSKHIDVDRCSTPKCSKVSENSHVFSDVSLMDVLAMVCVEGDCMSAQEEEVRENILDQSESSEESKKIQDRETAAAINSAYEISKEQSMQQIDLTLTSLRKLRQMCKENEVTVPKKDETETPAARKPFKWISARKQVHQPSTSTHPRELPSANKRSALKTLSSNIKSTPTTAIQTPTAKVMQRPRNLMCTYDGNEGTGKKLATPSPRAPMSTKRDLARSHHR